MKRIFAFLLSLIMLLSLSVPVFAAETEAFYTQDEIYNINKVNVGKYAMSFIDTIYNDSSLEAGDIFVFYSENDNISGYCVDVIKGGSPNGYVIVKFSANNPVVSEFVLGTGIENPYTMIMKEANIENDDAIFYSIGSNDYQILDLNRGVAVDDTSEIVSEKEFKGYKECARVAKQAADGVTISNDEGLNYSDLDGWTVVSDEYEGTVKEDGEKTINGADSISTWYCSDDVEANEKTYACSVVALCNLMKYYRSRGYDKISSSFTTLYDELWSHAGTNSSGTTSNGKEAPAAKKYLNNLGYTCSYTSYLFDNYSDFTKDLGNNRPCIFTYGAKFDNKSGGHAVLAVGYVDTSKYQYLKIADGWNNYLRYINFNGYNYSRTDGWAFNVSK